MHFSKCFKLTPVYIFLASLGYVMFHARADIIPPERLAPWTGNVGVPGGIPNRTLISTTLTPSGGNDAAAINSAISACPSGQVVKVGPGTFQVGGTIGSFNRRHYKLRGSGNCTTVLRWSGGSVDVISIRGNSNPFPPPSTMYPIISVATWGSNTITLSDTSAFNVNSILRIVWSPI